MKKFKQLLTTNNISYRSLSDAETQELNRNWLNSFASNVKEKTGKSIYRGYRWHAYSYEFETHLKGTKALSEYFSQPVTKYYVFNEECDEAYECTSDKYPDFSSNFDEVYVCHHNMKWSMVFTHEQPELGPYFAYRNEI